MNLSPTFQLIDRSIKLFHLTQVNWSGPNIVVFNDVTITPPYKLENVTGSPESRQLAYVKKIVSPIKFDINHVNVVRWKFEFKQTNKKQCSRLTSS